MTSTTTVRVHKSTHRRLQKLAREAGVTVPEIVDRLVEVDRRCRLFDDTDEAYVALQADRDDWEAELAERGAWDAALADGLSGDETERELGATATDQV